MNIPIMPRPRDFVSNLETGLWTDEERIKFESALETYHLDKLKYDNYLLGIRIDSIFNENAKKIMNNWNFDEFKLTHPKLYLVIVNTMKEINN